MSVLEGKPEKAVDRVKAVRSFCSTKGAMDIQLFHQAYVPTLVRNWYQFPPFFDFTKLTPAFKGCIYSDTAYKFFSDPPSSTLLHC